jgi:hypothetical protein
MNITLDLVLDSALFPNVKDNVKNPNVYESALGGIRGFVDKVLYVIGANDMSRWKSANPANKINVLRIWSHGFVNFERSELENGNIIFGTDNLKAENFKSFSPVLDLITPHFVRPARVELRGCIAAKGTGEKMMIDLANLWKADVYGSDKYMPQILSWASTVFVAKPGATKITLTNGPDVN